MRIVIAGGSGLLGGALATASAGHGDEVVVLTRGSRAVSAARVRTAQWTPDGGTGAWASELDGAGAVINLAGESIGDKRWSEAQKRRILESRLLATRSLVAAIESARTPPAVFVSGSAVGYYGPHADEIVNEDTAAGSDFLAGVCVKWEAEAARASKVRTVLLRTGLVLDRNGGALPKMLLPFKLGAGGPIGSGRQYWPWIHRDDWVELVRWAMATPGVSGPINATAPHPLANADFARALGKAMHRPAFMPTPAFALRIMLGEMADALLLTGQRAVPARALAQRFTFRHPHLDAALKAIFSGPA